MVTTSPPTSTAAHKVVVGHEMSTRKFPVVPPMAGWWLVSTVSWSQLLALSPVGSVERTTIPLAPTATQRVVVGHDTAVSRTRGLGVVVDQVGLAALASVETITSPPRSTATHIAGVGHETPLSCWFCTTLVAVHTIAPPVGLMVVQTLPW